MNQVTAPGADLTQGERYLPTVYALGVVIALAFSAFSWTTLDFRAFTTEDARRLRIAAAPAPISSPRVIGADGVSQTLWNADGKTRVWLVTFMYASCPSVCLASGTEFQQLQASIGAADGVRLASLSFDRGRDTPEALAAYARRFRADPARWLVAVPESDAMLSRLLRETGVVAIEDGVGGYVHNAAIHVVTASGRLVALFDPERYQEARAYARELAR